MSRPSETTKSTSLPIGRIPSFGGGWSPVERAVNEQGFKATWRTTHLATGGQALWEKLLRDNKLTVPGNAAGVPL
jgi:inner membrane protein involved in colicin E2 resistance